MGFCNDVRDGVQFVREYEGVRPFGDDEPEVLLLDGQQQCLLCPREAAGNSASEIEAHKHTKGWDMNGSNEGMQTDHRHAYRISDFRGGSGQGKNGKNQIRRV